MKRLSKHILPCKVYETNSIIICIAFTKHKLSVFDFVDFENL